MLLAIIAKAAGCTDENRRHITPSAEAPSLRSGEWDWMVDFGIGLTEAGTPFAPRMSVVLASKSNAGRWASLRQLDSLGG